MVCWEGGKQQMGMIRQWTFRQGGNNHPPTIFDFGRAVGGGMDCHNGQMESFLKGGDGRRPLTTAVCLSAGVQVASVSVSSLAGQALVRGQEGHPQIFIQVR